MWRSNGIAHLFARAYLFNPTSSATADGVSDEETARIRDLFPEYSPEPVPGEDEELTQEEIDAIK